MATKKIDVAADDATNQDGAPEHYLVVRHAFDNYRKGDAIRDEAAIAQVLAGDNARNVHKVIG